MLEFHARYNKAVLELAAIHQKMPHQKYLLDEKYTIDESVPKSKLLVNGEIMVFDEDLYDLVEPAFQEAKVENPGSSRTLIQKTRAKFLGPGKYGNYHLRAESLDYLDPSVYQNQMLFPLWRTQKQFHRNRRRHWSKQPAPAPLPTTLMKKWPLLELVWRAALLPVSLRGPAGRNPASSIATIFSAGRTQPQILKPSSE
jgi:hypothetical protein